MRLVARVKNIATMNELSRGIRLGGQIANWMLGRPSILALSPSLVHWFWQSRPGLQRPDLQGVFTPGVFSVTVAYINDEWEGRRAGKALSAYVSGTVLGGFSCRFISGLVASRWEWRWSFVVWFPSD